MYKLKQSPEDFVVEEVTSVKSQGSGRYSYFWMRKRDYNVVDAVHRIASALKIAPSRIGFAGTKDKVAVTTQLVSFADVERKRVERLALQDIGLTFYGYGDAPISLGDLEGNRFRIVVRDAEVEPKRAERFLNLFGEQRFSKSNVDIGRAMLKGDFRLAAELIDRHDVREYLAKRPTDHIGAIRRMPKKILMIFVHSYQSWLWNNVALALEDNGEAVEEIPLVGFDTDLSGKAGEALRSLMEKDGISQRDFIIRSIPELTSEGGMRAMYADIKGLEIARIGGRDYRISFFLGKGSYATVVIRRLFS